MVTIKLLLVLIFSSSLLFAGTRQEAEAILSKLEVESSVIKRLDLASKSFLGLPYGKGGPLGEGSDARYDQDPLYRFDTFDCTTYIETIISLALSSDVQEFEEKMNDIRYHNGEVDYLKRNHFPSLQWIPHNVENGLLKEINNSVVPARLQKVAEAEINFPGWLKKHKLEQIVTPKLTPEERELRLQELQEFAIDFSPVKAQLNYIPIDYLVTNPHLLKRIPHGAIVNFVRPNWNLTEAAGTHMNVSHQGLLFRKGKVIYLRHASTTGLVKEEVFLDYLKKFAGHATLKGIHLMKVNTGSRFLFFL